LAVPGIKRRVATVEYDKKIEYNCHQIIDTKYFNNRLRYGFSVWPANLPAKHIGY